MFWYSISLLDFDLAKMQQSGLAAHIKYLFYYIQSCLSTGADPHNSIQQQETQYTYKYEDKWVVV